MSITIEAVYALPDAVLAADLELAPGSDVAAAVLAAQQHERFRKLDLVEFAVGIFGEVVEGSQILRDGDRVEFYRPLLVDPKEARRMRAGEAGRG